MFDRRAERTPCGLTLADVETLMAARVTAWADAKHAAKVAHDAADQDLIARQRTAWQADVLRQRRNGANFRARRKALGRTLGLIP